MKKILLLSFALIFLLTAPARAAFDKKSDAPQILLAEVAGYGQFELKPEFMANFYDVIREKLQENFNVESRITLIDEPSEEDEIFSIIHMDAIAHSHLYRRELANVKMTRYGDSIKGKEYYQNELKTQERLKLEGKPYYLTPEIFDKVFELGKKYEVDYMIFCNVRDADVWRKTGGIFGASPSTYDLRGKRVQIEMEYFLINVKNGKVFEGQNSEKRTSLTTNVLIGKYGNNYTVGDMVNYVLQDQADKLVKNILKHGLKAVD
jgi:hypothetical protein